MSWEVPIQFQNFTGAWRWGSAGEIGLQQFNIPSQHPNVANSIRRRFVSKTSFETSIHPHIHIHPYPGLAPWNFLNFYEFLAPQIPSFEGLCVAICTVHQFISSARDGRDHPTQPAGSSRKPEVSAAMAPYEKWINTGDIIDIMYQTQWR